MASPPAARQPYALTLTGTGGTVRMAQVLSLGFEVQRAVEDTWRTLATHHPRLPLRARVDNIARDGSFTLMASLS